MPRSQQAVGASDRSPAFVAAVASLAGHVLIIFAAAAALQPVPPPERDLARQAPLVATAWLIPEPTPTPVDFAPTPIQLPMTALAITVPPPELPEIEGVAIGAFDKAEQPQDGADAAELEHLQGLYVKQINARLARVLKAYWPDRPALTQCTARVVQDEVGRVLDVDLQECLADEPSHVMLTRVIRAAGPLPRPPEGLAMASYLTLDLSVF